jgi:hypothetical protein
MLVGSGTMSDGIRHDCLPAVAVWNASAIASRAPTQSSPHFELRKALIGNDKSTRYDRHARFRGGWLHTMWAICPTHSTCDYAKAKGPVSAGPFALRVFRRQRCAHMTTPSCTQPIATVSSNAAYVTVKR